MVLGGGGEWEGLGWGERLDLLGGRNIDGGGEVLFWVGSR